jgi:DNA-binding NtrC family response regulator
VTDPVEQDLAGILVGVSAAMRSVRRDIMRFGATRLPVLVQGPTGTGKELVARALHMVSRRPGALVAFNVCALNDGMFEDALFGHVKGAFTGAARDAPGYLAEANGGSLFLDEISGLRLESQPKLLRALETGTFRPVGAHRDRVSDFRIVSASNEDLQARVREDRFREDLLHRLGGFTVHLAPLAQRPEDIPPLAAHFARQLGSPFTEIEPAAIDYLMGRPWSGNVRELRYTVERALVFAAGATVTVADVRRASIGTLATSSPTVEAIQKDVLLAALHRSNWDPSRVATELGVHRATVYRWMRRHRVATPPRAPVRANGSSDHRLETGESVFRSYDRTTRSCLSPCAAETECQPALPQTAPFGGGRHS